MRRFVALLLADRAGVPDEQALISLTGAVVFFGLQIYSVVWRGEIFDPLTFGTGMGALLGATSAGFAIRDKVAATTPPPTAVVNPITGRIMDDSHADIAR